MTNYPRDEFDRVPEFSNRNGAHRAAGWAASAASAGGGSGLRWLMITGAFALFVGLFSFLLLPGMLGGQDPQPIPPATAPSATPSTTKKPAPTKASTEPKATGSTGATGAVELPESTSNPGPTATDAEALANKAAKIGIYNGSTRGGLAGTGTRTLNGAGFTQVSAGNWTKKVTYSTVYYRQASSKSTAEAAAEALGITSVMQSTNIPGEIAVVLGRNFNP
ncbi:LytR C-terminal domain-containing protein [Paeniglutamicibacter cryotolerans]|uniref:LytR/CpsA/Psr regulator C-terminal domain-containing protein n=1 Tax=Paeniglutamicibacter cryotolerans TaxID=670079 RepID=A0A839QKV8_9MICC|nr:LytR C-terminal domain-containing protein [Paeniglutamicibacter cryotolerans]MBB2995404.1 hypothetical protein [Paeniglutamicibacter cryotolerans]